MTTFDLATGSLREINKELHDAKEGSFSILNPEGAHAVAAGLTAPLQITVAGSVGYYGAGMNQEATVTFEGKAGTGVAENMMSGRVVVESDAGQSAAATAHGGLLVVRGNASARCGISLKGADIVVGGNVGHMSAFMAQSGNLIVLGDAGASLGDSIYEADLFVRGTVESLGSDCVAKEMTDEHAQTVARLLGEAGLDGDPGEFTRYGSARELYNFNVDDVDLVENERKAQR